jgi:PAS domain S-box-containing protein/diguanylate cyclase (GGDEF)-like protein
MPTILVVEDSPTSRLLLVTVLGYAGYSVIEAADGAEALDLVRAQHPDLVISDVLMPTMDGIEFANRLRGDEAIAHIPVIFYTSTYRLNEARVLAQSCGVSRVLSKPSEPQVILDEIAIALGKEPAALLPTAKTALPGLLGDKLPAYLHELVELQQRLHKALNEGLELIGENGPLRNVSDRLIDSYGTVQALSLRMAALLELGLVLSTERDPQQLLRLFCRAAQNIMNAKYAAVGINMKDGQPLHFVSCGMTDTEVSNVLNALDPQAGIFGAVLTDGKPRRVSDIEGNQTVPGLPASHPPVHTFLVVPVIARTGTHGWLYFANKIGADRFGEDDEQFAMTLSAQLAPAYENLILYEEVQQHAGQLEIEFTERKRAEQALRESEERYRQLWETTTDAIIMLGADNVIQYANPAVQDNFGYAPGELVGQNLAMIQPEKLRAAHRHGFKRYLESNVKTLNWRGTEAIALHRDGHEFPVEIAFSHMVIGDKPLFAAFIRDVTERKRAAEGLQESESRFRQLAANVHEVFFLIDPKNTQILYISRAYEEIWGRSCESLYAQPQSWLDAVHPDDLETVRKGNAERDATGQFEYEYRIIRPDQSIRWVRAHGSPIHNDAGEIYRVAGVAKDITEQKEQQEKIARLSRIYAVLSGINSAIVRIHDRSELFQEACRIAVAEGAFRMAWIGVIEPNALDGKIIASSGAKTRYLDKIKLTVRTDTPDSERPACRAVREMKPVICNDISKDLTLLAYKTELLKQGCHSIAAFPLSMQNRGVAVLVLLAAETGFFDEQELKLLNELAADIVFGLQYIEKEERLSYLAYYDALTGLPNSTLFHDRLTQFLQSAKHSNGTIAVILIDLDSFTQLNDTLGRHVGDMLLRTTATRLNEVLREPYSLARISADTFAIAVADLQHGTDAAEILHKRIFKSLNQPYVENDIEVRISARAGIALYPGDGEDTETLFKNAEAALKQAQSTGTRYLYYAPQINAKAAEKLALESRLHEAVEREQFVLYYQPKLDAKSGQIAGFEALIRWNDPHTGLVPPVDFIPILERTGAILEVGEWVMKQALSDYRTWQDAGLQPPRIAVNVSLIQLRRQNFAEVVGSVIKASGIDPQALELEITESLIMEDTEANIKTLQQIRDMGVTIAIDDFGTGYSSLRYLASLPIDTLKIDRSFIITMMQDPNSMAIVSTIISLAHALGLSVVAEGVDSEDQSKHLRLMKCDEMQGYLFSKPVPADECAALLQEQLTKHPESKHSK